MQEWFIPEIPHGNDSELPGRNLLEGLDGEEEMVVRRIADATGIKGEVPGMLIGTPGRLRAQELGWRRGGVPDERP
jgi:hypothetical protein